MKHIFSTRNKLTRSTVSVMLTALVLAAVLALNVLFSALSSRGLWFVDLTTYTRQTKQGTEVYENYTLTDEIVEYLDTTFSELNAVRQSRGEEAVEVEIIFCDDPDNLMSNLYQRTIYIAALEMQKEFPDTIKVKNIDIYKNPSAVQKYKTNAYTTIYSTSIIVASGTEYRRLTPKSFFFEDSTTGEWWASKVEVNFASNIRAVTKAEAPKCVFLTNHGESGYTDSFISLLEDTGYEVITSFDLENDELPEDCRLVVSCAPVKDFKGYADTQGDSASVSEIEKLRRFLDDENSLMVFFNADTPVLPTFEEYLEDWGVVIKRAENEVGERNNYLIRDMQGALTEDKQTFVADYVTAGLGASVTSDMQERSYPAKVVFRNATALELSDSYKPVYMVKDADGNRLEQPYTYGSYAADGVYRQAQEVFTSPLGCIAYAGDDQLGGEDDGAIYKLMTVATETQTAPGDRNGYTTVSHTSYVVACASSEFLADELLSTNAYGNTDMLASVVRTLGIDRMSALIDQYIKPFTDNAVATDLITTQQKKTTTILLCLIPAAILFGCGIYVMTKRKYS